LGNLLKDESNTKQTKFLDMLEINCYIVRTRVVKKIKFHDGGQIFTNLYFDDWLDFFRLAADLAKSVFPAEHSESAGGGLMLKLTI